MSKDEIKKMLKIDKSYYLNILQQLHVHDIIDSQEKNNTYWASKAIDYIKENKN